ncbi:MAG: hypothetical protein JST26_13115 [Bacteroidetes bacterium]|nr:hypothetical protein [Bacteroidota bacterium]
MKLSYLFVAILSAGIFLACHSSKSATTSSSSSTSGSGSSTASSSSAAPSTETLVNIAKSKWPDITAATINEGKDLYQSGACTGCHGPKNITKRSAEEWPGIIDRMATKAKISDTQKDAVLKYVLAMKMANP